MVTNASSIFAIPLSGGIIVPVNNRLQPGDISYILDFAEVDAIIADISCEELLSEYRSGHSNVEIIVDDDLDTERGQYEDAIKAGQCIYQELEKHGKRSVDRQIESEHDIIAIPFTSGTTARPKGVEYTHRGVYLAAMAGIVESGLNFHNERCGYLWTLPMFHAMGSVSGPMPQRY